MRIIVCIKQVPSSNEVRLDPVTNTIIRDGKKSVVNPYDSFALEQAVQLKEELGGEVAVLSMGIPATETLLRDAMSRGADRSLLLSDRAFAGADTLATSYALSLGVQRLGAFDLILCGKMAIDGDTAQIGPELAEQLGVVHVTDVTAILEAKEGQLICSRTTGKETQVLRVQLPALLTVAKDINLPRFPSIAGVAHGLSAPYEQVGATELGADLSRCGLDGSPTQVVATRVPQRNGECQLLTGAVADQAAALLKIIEGEG